jgi:hypothetical protein
VRLKIISAVELRSGCSGRRQRQFKRPVGIAASAALRDDQVDGFIGRCDKYFNDIDLPKLNVFLWLSMRPAAGERLL